MKSFSFPPKRYHKKGRKKRDAVMLEKKRGRKVMIIIFDTKAVHKLKVYVLFTFSHLRKSVIEWVEEIKRA